MKKESSPPPSRERFIDRSRRAVKKVLIPTTASVAGLLALAGAWGAKHYVFKDNPSSTNSPIEESIGSVPGGTSFSKDGSVPQLEGLSPHLEQPFKPNEDEVFDNGATSGVISNSNKVILPQEEIDRLFPTAFGKLASGDKTITSVSQNTPPEIVKNNPDKNYPDIQVEVSKEKNTLQLQYFLDLNESADPNAEISVTKTFSGFGQTVREEFQGEGYYDTIHFSNVPNGTRILLPVGGYTILFPNAEDPAKNNGILIDFVAPNGDFYRIGIMGFDGVTTTNLSDPRFAGPTFIFKNLVDIPLFSPEANHSPVGTYGRQGERGSAVLEVTQPQGRPVEIVVQLFTALKGNVEERARPLDNPYVLTTLELFSTPEGKLIAPKQS